MKSSKAGILAIAFVLASVTILVLVDGSLAAAQEVTREEYTARVEPICEVSTKANEKILADVRTEVKKGKLEAAAAQFSTSSTALRKTLVKLRAVPQPLADKTKLAKWLGYVGEEAALLERVSQKLAADNKFAAQAMVVRLTHTANVANNEVLGFDFTYCRFDPSKFT